MVCTLLVSVPKENIFSNLPKIKEKFQEFNEIKDIHDPVVIMPSIYKRRITILCKDTGENLLNPHSSPKCLVAKDHKAGLAQRLSCKIGNFAITVVSLSVGDIGELLQAILKG